MPLLLNLDEKNIGNRSHILQRIVLVRSLMLLISIFILGIFSFGLERSLNYPVILGIITVGAIFCAISQLRIFRKTPVTDSELFAHLCGDAAILVALVAFSGAATNPFIYYYLVLVGMAATIFNSRIAWLYCTTAIIAYSSLMYSGLNEHAHHGFNDFQLHLLGMWFNFVGSSALMCFFVSRLSQALKNREKNIAAIREKNLNNERVLGIATLAASTAHNLGTPLTTMSLLIDDFDSASSKKDIEENVSLLSQQIQRCKEELGKLSTLAEPKHSTKPEKELCNLIQELDDHYRILHAIKRPVFTKTDPGVLLSADPVLFYALINLIDNALEASLNSCEVSCSCDNNRITIEISNDGPAIPNEIVENWGNPIYSPKEDGLGIGVLLANSSIESLNGRVIIQNRTADNYTVVSVELPRYDHDDEKPAVSGR